MSNSRGNTSPPRAFDPEGAAGRRSRSRENLQTAKQQDKFDLQSPSDSFSEQHGLVSEQIVNPSGKEAKQSSKSPRAQRPPSIVLGSSSQAPAASPSKITVSSQSISSQGMGPHNGHAQYQSSVAGQESSIPNIRFAPSSAPFRADSRRIDEDAGTIGTLDSSLNFDSGMTSIFAYLIGWISALVIIFTERRSTYVLFHAFQSLIISVTATILTFLTFWSKIATTLVWVFYFILWAVCMAMAYKHRNTGHLFKLQPFIGDFSLSRAEARVARASGIV